MGVAVPAVPGRIGAEHSRSSGGGAAALVLAPARLQVVSDGGCCCALATSVGQPPAWVLPTLGWVAASRQQMAQLALGRHVELIQLLQRQLNIPPAIRPAMAGRAAQPADDELIPPLFADLGDLGWDLAVVGRLDLQPRVTVIAVAGSLSRAVLAVTPPGRLALHGPVVPAGVPGDLMAQVGDLPRLAALATGDVHCVCSFRRWARGGSAGRAATPAEEGCLAGRGVAALRRRGGAPAPGRMACRSPTRQCRGPRRRRGRPSGRRAAAGVPDRAGAREERTGLAGAGVALGWGDGGRPGRRIADRRCWDRWVRSAAFLPPLCLGALRRYDAETPGPVSGRFRDLPRSLRSGDPASWVNISATLPAVLSPAGRTATASRRACHHSPPAGCERSRCRRRPTLATVPGRTRCGWCRARQTCSISSRPLPRRFEPVGREPAPAGRTSRLLAQQVRAARPPASAPPGGAPGDPRGLLSGSSTGRNQARALAEREARIPLGAAQLGGERD